MEVDDYQVGKDDPARRWIAKAEWDRLSEVERNQLALDRWLAPAEQTRGRRAPQTYKKCVGYSARAGWMGCGVPRSRTRRVEDLGRDVDRSQGWPHGGHAVQTVGTSDGPDPARRHVHQLVRRLVRGSMRRDLPGSIITGTFDDDVLALRTLQSLRPPSLGSRSRRKPRDSANFPRIKCNVGRGRRAHLPPAVRSAIQLDCGRTTRRGERYALTCTGSGGRWFPPRVAMARQPTKRWATGSIQKASPTTTTRITADGCGVRAVSRSRTPQATLDAADRQRQRAEETLAERNRILEEQRGKTLTARERRTRTVVEDGERQDVRRKSPRDAFV